MIYCLLLPFWCAAVKPYKPVMGDPILEPWRWRQEEALDRLGVLCMDEAADGTLWFGNIGSIAHYDGVDVTRIPFDDKLLSMITHQKDVPWAKALLVLPDGNLLVLVGESLILREHDAWTVIVQDVGESVFSSQLIQAGDGTIWLLVPDALWRISADLSVCSKVVEPSGGGLSLLSFCIDSSGDLWVVEKTEDTYSRLILIPAQNGYSPAGRSEFNIPVVNDQGEARIVADEDGLIWYADDSSQSGLKAFDPHRREWLVREESKKTYRFFSLLKTRDGSVWAGESGRMLHLSRTGEEVLYDYNQVPLPLVALSLFEAGNGRVWVIGRVGHVCSADFGTGEWATYEDLNFLCESQDGKQWFRLRKQYSMVSYDPHRGEWLQYGAEDNVIDSPYAMICSSHGLQWAAGRHKGSAAVAVFDGTRWTRYCHPEFAQWIEPNSVVEAADGTVWFGAGGELLASVPHAGGALQYEVKKDGMVQLLKHHAPPDFPYYVTALEQTADGTMWIGSTAVYRYDGTLPIHPVAGLGGENSADMALDHSQTLWLAKENFGVCRREGDAWTVFTGEDDVADLEFCSMTVLKDGSLLVASHKGISRFDGKSWTAKAYPEDFAMTRRRSGIKESSDGSLWLNYAYNEMWVFRQIGSAKRKCYTVRHRPEQIPPDTHITDYLKRVSPPGNSHIIWSAHDPWSSTPQEELQYSWRMDGGEWSAFSHETGRTFLALASGRHTLEVRARDRAFNIDPTPDRIEFSVIPPVWKQAWFLTMVSVFIGLILLLVWILIRTRERYLLEKQAERETLLVKQQEEREKNLVERQAEREAFLQKQQVEREAHLVEIDRLKTGFFTNISHELRTPLTVILGPLEMMLKTEADPKKQSAFSLMVRNAQRVATLITQLLDFRKIEEGKIGIEATYGDLAPVVNEVVTSLRPLAENARISCFLESVSECRGWFDFDKLQKIFTNLIANSIKYTAAGGEVRVSLLVEHEAQERRLLRFVVEDTGIGIAQEHLGHIFERFYRVSETSAAVGAGIGLNLTKELVDLLGGEIQAESPIHSDTERPGTRFTVRLPVDVSESPDVQQLAGQESSVGDATNRPDISDKAYNSGDGSPLILVVEDDEDIREFIVEGLNSSFRVETAGDGAAGLRIAKEQVPDLIVTDVMMPVMDGITLCRELKTSLETSHIPVILLTAKSSIECQVEGLKTGADDYITKPFHMELLQIRIANLLESRRLLREKFCSEYSVLTPEIPENSAESEFLKKAVQVLEENYSSWEFTLDDFASALNMSLRTLSRKFKAVADRTPADFINEFRMMRAAELLSGTTCTIAEIAFQVGYDEPANFTRTFKKYCEMTPSQYRSGFTSS